MKTKRGPMAYPSGRAVSHTQFALRVRTRTDSSELRQSYFTHRHHPPTYYGQFTTGASIEGEATVARPAPPADKQCRMTPVSSLKNDRVPVVPTASGVIRHCL